MSVDLNTVRRVALLSRLDVDEERLPALAEELNQIIAWVEQLNAVDVSGIEPLTSVVHQRPKMRDDVVTDGGYPADLMSNAPHSEDNFFVVPKVVE